MPPFEEVRGASVRTPVQTRQMYEPDLGGKGYNIFEGSQVTLLVVADIGRSLTGTLADRMPVQQQAEMENEERRVKSEEFTCVLRIYLIKFSP